MAGAVLLSWATFSTRVMRPIRSRTRAWRGRSGSRYAGASGAAEAGLARSPATSQGVIIGRPSSLRARIDRELAGDPGRELGGLHRLAGPLAHAGDRHGPGRDPGVASGQETGVAHGPPRDLDRKSTRLNSSHITISYAVF